MQKVYVYACLYDSLDRVLMAKKNERAIFFDWKITAPQDLTKKGGGKLVLPGGEMNNKQETWKNIIQEALREFAEETGYELQKMRTYNEEETICTKFEYQIKESQNRSKAVYYVAYIKTHEFEDARWRVDECLDQGKRAAEWIESVKEDWEDWNSKIKEKFPLCPKDNELRETKVLDIDTNEGNREIEKMKSDQHTDWFYYALEFMRKTKLDQKSAKYDVSYVDQGKTVTSECSVTLIQKDKSNG